MKDFNAASRGPERPIATKSELLARLRARETPRARTQLTLGHDPYSQQARMANFRENERRIGELSDRLNAEHLKLDRHAIEAGLRSAPVRAKSWSW